MKSLKSAFSLLVIELAFVLIFVIFWASNKGFEFSDEAYSVLSITQSAESTDIFYYQHIINFFLGWLNPGFVGLRLLRLFLTMLSAFVLTVGLNRIFLFNESVDASSKGVRTFVLFSISFIAVAISYSIYPQAVSYNNLTEIGLAMLSGFFIMYSLNVVEYKSKSVARCSFLIGVMAMFVFFCRFSTGLLLFLVVPVLYLIVRLKNPSDFKLFLKDVLYFGIGVLTTFILSSIFIHSGVEWLIRMNDSLNYIPGHDVSEILLTYWESVIYVFDNLFDQKLLFPAFVLVLVNFKGQLESKAYRGLNLYQVLSALFLIFLMQYNIESEFVYSGVKYFSTALFFHLVIILCVFILLFSKEIFLQIIKSFRNNLPLIAIALILLIIPFIGSVGTNNSLHIQFLQFVFAWVLLATIILYKLRKFIGPVLGGGLVLIMIIGSFSQIVHGLVYSPYRISGTLFDQKISKELKSGDILLVDSKTNAAISEFELTMSNLKEYQKGDPMILLMSVPGYIYLAEASVVKNAWANSVFPETVCHSINNSLRDDLERSIIITPRSRSLHPLINQCLHDKGILFPEAYVRRTSFVDPVYNLQMDIYIRSN